MAGFSASITPSSMLIVLWETFGGGPGWDSEGGAVCCDSDEQRSPSPHVATSHHILRQLL